ncbi:hypothetical protein J1614_000489 [Plenodomus biglobosus]|nr:hypothetical protein J1614_000489 [Plenodomus biglobosus]
MRCTNYLDKDAIQTDITRDNLLAGAQQLEDFADAYENQTRIIGSPGHNDTIYWLKSELEALDYYDVSLQSFFAVFMISGELNTFLVNGANTSGNLLEYSASGKTDFPAEVAGNIALISRGSCDYGQKSALAGNAGAAAVVIYNNAAGGFNGTLGTPPREEGEYITSISISQELGTSFVEAINAGNVLNATVDVTTEIQNISTHNVLATTKSGDQTNKLALGAHTDSVPEGPGINDNGSGTIGILEVAKALSKYEIKNAVTFGFWSAEEQGLLGSAYYVKNLPANESASIRAYLNFDMIASPNYIHAIYDGDGSGFNITGPAGSDVLEAFLEDYFTSAGENFTSTAFDGRSDYGPFLDVGIPCGGTFTGGEELKTEKEVDMFGGEVGVALDACYHAACDNVANLNMTAFELHTKAIASAVATYSTSWDGFPMRNTTGLARRNTVRPCKSNASRHFTNRHALRFEK